MSEMPGRIFVHKRHLGNGEEQLAVSWLPQKGDTAYCPEQRALDAERERDNYRSRHASLLKQNVQQADELEAAESDLRALDARVRQAEGDLRAVGGYDNELRAVPAGGVRAILKDLRVVLARLEKEREG